MYGISIFIVIAAFLSSLSSAEDVDNHFEPIRCESNNDCSFLEACYDNQCVDACLLDNGAMVDKKCGANSYCAITSAHTASCLCYTSYVDNPAGGCIYNPKTVPSCTNDNDCATYQVCHKGKCVDICQYHNGSIVEYKCAKYAHCFEADNHQAQCSCYSSYHGDPYSYCEKDGERGPPCENDNDCPYYAACLNTKCDYICRIHDGQKVHHKCGINAYCYDTGPHMADCKCHNGYRGDPFTACNKDS